MTRWPEIILLPHAKRPASALNNCTHT
jgi:hypothetical protein